MSGYFEKYAHKGDEILARLAAELGKDKDLHTSARVLRNVLHVLRNHLSTEESLQLLAQLPLVVKGMYVDSWKLHKKTRRIRRVEELVAELMEADGIRLAEHDFSNEAGARHALRSVLKVLSLYVSEGELHDIAQLMPGEVKAFMESAIAEKSAVF